MASTFRAVISDIKGALDNTTLLHPVHLTPSSSSITSSTLTPLVLGAWPLYISDPSSPFAKPAGISTTVTPTSNYTTTLSPILLSIVAAGPVEVPIGGHVGQYIAEGALPQTVLHAASAAGLLVREGVDITPAATHHHLIQYCHTTNGSPTATTPNPPQHHVALVRIKSPSLSQVISQTTLHTRVGLLLGQIVTMLDKQEAYDDWKELQVEARDRHQGASMAKSNNTTTHHSTHLDPKTVGAHESLAFLSRKASRMIDFNVMEGDVSHESHRRAAGGESSRSGPLSSPRSSITNAANILHRSGSADLRRIASDMGLLQVLWDVAGFDSQADDAESLQEELRRALGRQRDVTIPNEDVLDRRIPLSSRLDIITAAAADPTLAALQISYLKMKLVALNALRVLVPLPSPLAHTLNNKGLPFGAPHGGVVWPYNQMGASLTKEALMDMCENIGAPTAVVSHLFVEAMRATVVESSRLHTLTTTTTSYNANGDGSPPPSPVHRRNSSLTSPPSQRAQSPTISSPLTRRTSSFVGRVFGGGLAVEADRGLQGLVCSVTRIQEQLRNTTDAVASAIIQLADHHATGAYLKFKALPLERRNLLYMSSWKSDGGAVGSEGDVKGGDGARRFTDEVLGQFMVHYQLQSQAQAASTPVGSTSGGVSSAAGGSLQSLLAEALNSITHTIVGDTTMLVRSCGDSMGALRDLIMGLYSSVLRSTNTAGKNKNTCTILSIYSPSIGPSSRKALLQLFLHTVHEYFQQTTRQGRDGGGSYIGSVVEESVHIVALVRGLCQVQEAVLGPITHSDQDVSSSAPHAVGFDDLTDMQLGRSVWGPFLSLLLTVAEQDGIDATDSSIRHAVFRTFGAAIASLRGCSLAASSIRNATKQHTTSATTASSDDGLSRLSTIVRVYNGLVCSLLSGDCYQISKPPTASSSKSTASSGLSTTSLLVFTPSTAFLERSADLFSEGGIGHDDVDSRAACAEAITWCLLLEKENSVYVSNSFVSLRHHRTILPSPQAALAHTPLTSSSLIAVTLDEDRMTPSDPLPPALLAYARIQGRLSNTIDRLLASLRPPQPKSSSTRRSSETIPPPQAPLHLSQRGGLDVLSQALVRIHPQLLVRSPQPNGDGGEEDPILEGISATLDTINTPLRKALYLQTDEFVLTSSVFSKTLTQGQISHVVGSGVGVSESLMSPRSKYHSPLETALDRAAKKLLHRPRIKVFACSDRSELQHELAQREKLMELTQHEIAVREGSCKAWSSMPASDVAEIRALYAEVAEHTVAVAELKACTDEVMDARVHVACPAGALAQDATTSNDGEDESLDTHVVMRDVLHFHQLRKDNDSLGSRQHRLSKYSGPPTTNQPAPRASSVGMNNSRPTSTPTTPRGGSRKAAAPTAAATKTTFMYPSLEEVDKNHHFWRKGGNTDTKEDEQHLHNSLRVLPPCGVVSSLMNGGSDEAGDVCVREAGIKKGGWVSYSDPTIASQTPAAGRTVNADGLWRSKSGTYSPNLRIEGRWEVGLPDHAPVSIRVLLADLKAALRPAMRSLTAHGKRKLYKTSYSKGPPSSSPIREVSPAESNRPNQHHPHPLPRFLVLPNVPAPATDSSSIASPNPRQFEADASTATTLEELAAGRWGSEPAPNGGSADQRDVIPFADGELRAIDEEEAVTQEACRQLAQVSVLYYVGVAMCTRPRNLHQASSSSTGANTPKHTASPVTILLLEEDHSATDVIATQRYSFNPVVGGSSPSSPLGNKPVISGGRRNTAINTPAQQVDTHTVVSPVTVGKHRADSFRRATDEYRPGSRRPSSPSVGGPPNSNHLLQIPPISISTHQGSAGSSYSNLKPPPTTGATTPRGGRRVSFHVHTENGGEGVDTLGVSGEVVMSDDEEESATSDGGDQKSPFMTQQQSRTHHNTSSVSGVASPSFIARRNVEMLHARMGLTKGRSFLLRVASPHRLDSAPKQQARPAPAVGGRRGGGGGLVREDVIAPTESLVSVLPGGGGTLFGGSGGIAVGSPAAAGFLLGGTQLTADKGVSIPHHIRRSALLQQRSLVAAFMLSQSYATSLADLEGNSAIPNHFLSLLDANDTCGDVGIAENTSSVTALSSSSAVIASNKSAHPTTSASLLAAPMLVRVLQDLQAAQRTAAKGYMSKAVSTNATAAFSSVSLASVFTSEPLSASVVEVSLSRLTNAIPAALRKKVAESGRAATDRYNELKRNGVTFDTMLGSSSTPNGGSVSRTPSGSPTRSPRRGLSESPSPSRLRPTDVAPPVAASFSSAMADISSLEELQEKVFIERAEEERRRAMDEGAPLIMAANVGGAPSTSTTKSIASVTSFLLKEVERLKQQLTIAEQERDAAQEEARVMREERDQLNNKAADGSMQLLLHNSMIKPLKEELRKVRAERNHLELQLLRYEQQYSHSPLAESDFEPQPY